MSCNTAHFVPSQREILTFVMSLKLQGLMSTALPFHIKMISPRLHGSKECRLHVIIFLGLPLVSCDLVQSLFALSPRAVLCDIVATSDRLSHPSRDGVWRPNSREVVVAWGSQVSSRGTERGM